MPSSLLELPNGSFSKRWKLERADSFEVQDLASRTRAFVYFSDDPWRCVFCPGSEKHKVHFKLKSAVWTDLGLALFVNLLHA